jgi:hypothetical protein
VFLVKDSSHSREERIKQFLAEDPSLSALLAVIHFEWTVRRAIIALGTSPNVAIRGDLKKRGQGLEGYKDIWKDEVFLNEKVQLRLPEVVQNWDGLGKAFRLRHRLVHGVASCDAEYARKRAHWAISATNDIRAVCIDKGINLDARLPVRRCTKA